MTGNEQDPAKLVVHLMHGDGVRPSEKTNSPTRTKGHPLPQLSQHEEPDTQDTKHGSPSHRCAAPHP